DARRAAPFRRPEALGPAGIVAAVALIVALLQFPSTARVVAALPRPPRLVVERADLEPELQAAAQLAREAEQSGDADIKQLANQINKLLQQIDAEELTRKEAFDKLAELENKYLKANDKELEYLKQKLRKAGDELSKSKLLKEAGKALKEEDIAEARKELEKLASDAEKRAADAKWDQKQREEAAKALEAAAHEQQRTQEEKKQQQEMQRLEEEARQLKKQLAERPNDQELQRRLQRNQRELQRLERERLERAEMNRQLERLQRELEKAAEQMRQKMSPEALKQLAEQMRQMENQITKLSNQERAQMQIAEIKEVLRRAGKSDGGQGRDGQGKDGDGKGQGMARAQNGKNGKGGEQLREFDQRAGGKKDTLLLGDNGQKSDSRLLLPMPMGPGGVKPGPGGEGKDQPGGNGDGIGNQHDPNLQGDITRLNSERHDTRVNGKEGAGPSRSQTILGSAEKGFASTTYKKVYGDYSAVVEEVMSKEKVPPGYRFYVKRYFQLIKPRE
ncbi:MAG: Endoglucanase, partial [Myxococcales bacterium]|nr:Endoglucanase [Myxococcales bacterium]